MIIERKSLFDSIVFDLLRESPRTFKQLYPAVAERLPGTPYICFIKWWTQNCLG